MYEDAASCKDIAWAPVTNWEPQFVTLAGWEPQFVTLAGYCYAARHGMKVLLVTPYRVSHWQRYGVTVHSDVSVCTDL